jgi:hypothetical protein
MKSSTWRKQISSASLLSSGSSGRQSWVAGPLSSPSFALSVSAQKRADRKPPKPNPESSIEQEMSMLRALPPGTIHTIGTLHKKQGKQREKQPCNLQPENTAGVSKRSQQRLPEGSCALFSCFHPFCGTGTAILGRNGDRRGRRRPLYPFSDHIGSDPDTDAKRSAHFLWLHRKSLPAS